MAAVVNPDFEAEYRKICRWFSETYSTPLPHVEYELEVSYVLLHYFEHYFIKLRDAMDDSPATLDLWQTEYNRILDPENYQKVQEEHESQDEEWVKQMTREIEEQEKAKQVKDLPDPNLEDEVIISRNGEANPPNFPEG